eukprot:m.104655 g.104655  ORF g.104655 m.104655 type:complete len:110 (-) comp20959_c0_seq1:87-416(-)
MWSITLQSRTWTATTLLHTTISTPKDLGRVCLALSSEHDRVLPRRAHSFVLYCTVLCCGTPSFSKVFQPTMMVVGVFLLLFGHNSLRLRPSGETTSRPPSHIPVSKKVW